MILLAVLLLAALTLTVLVLVVLIFAVLVLAVLMHWDRGGLGWGRVVLGVGVELVWIELQGLVSSWIGVE